MKILKANLKYTEILTPLKPDKVLFIILHHAGAITATPQQIHQWHLEKHWVGAAYNYYVRKDGTVYGMRDGNVGAHCSGYNNSSIGICAEGDYDKEKKMPDLQHNSIISLIEFIKLRYTKISSICGHRHLFNTGCPGKYFPLSDIFEAVNIDNFTSIIHKFVKKGIISSPDYWLYNCVNGKTVDGKHVNTIILRFSAMFRIIDTFEEAVAVLKDMGVINSPNYWILCKDGFMADGMYVRKLLENMANKF